MTALDEWALTSSCTALPPRAPMLTTWTWPSAGPVAAASRPRGRRAALLTRASGRRTQPLLAAARVKRDSYGLDAAVGWAMAQAKESDVVAGRDAAPGAEGFVLRPGLIGRLGAAARVTVVSAPPGSGKTVLLRSWISAAGLAERVAWMPVEREERDPQRFWLSVLGALRQTAPGSAVVRPLTAAPELDGWAVVERLLKDLAQLAAPPPPR